ncbi:hypothetical protein DFLDMN_000710 [Cupriavidus sp. H19C3]
MARQMGYAHALKRFGVVRGEVIEFPMRQPRTLPLAPVAVGELMQA